jgi:signal transduction histidine kinase
VEADNQAEGKKRVITHIAKFNKKVMLDPKLLKQIIENLLSNALKYSPLDKEIIFDCAADDEIIRFVVKDQGIGIPEEDLKRLFETFHRAKNVGSIAGTGLGLSIVKNAVTLHNGTITVESEVGKGTCFVVRLPLIFAED